MKRKFRIAMIVTSVALMSAPMTTFAACGETTPSAPPPANDKYVNSDYDVNFLEDYSLDEALIAACPEAGTVENFTYQTHSYMLESLPENEGKEIVMEKTAQIYLPYGYDADGKYDILYLLHGTGEEQERYWFTINKPTTQNMLDNLIYSGVCKPTIVVCPNYYSIPDDYEAYHNISILSDPNADSWPMYFYEELRNDLIPAVEVQYATYAEKDVTLTNLQATREHRAFAGLSRGSMTVVNSGMIHCTDLFAYFGSYSGIWADFNTFKSALTGEFNDFEIKYWYNGTGTLDTVGSPKAMINQIEFCTQALEELSDKFKDNENFALIVLEGGKHEYRAWLVDLYNSMLVFFK